MPRTPKRLAGPAQVATGPTTLYTVPAATKTILRYLHVSNPSAGAVGLTLSVGTDGVTTRIYSAYSIPAAAAGVSDSVRQIPVYIVMEATEILTASATSNNVLTLTVNGDELTLG
jgi:hypothetical protein